MLVPMHLVPGNQHPVPSHRGKEAAPRLSANWLVINGTSLKKSRGGHQKFIHHGPNISHDVLHKYFVAKDAVAQGRPFLWNLEEYYYDWWQQFQTALSGATRTGSVTGANTTGAAEPFVRCRFVRMSEPGIVRWVVPRFESAVGGVPLSAMSLLHVRRGTVGEMSGLCCNTSIQALVNFLSCNGKLRSMSPSRRQQQRLLIFTDEHDRTYINDLTQQLNAASDSQTVHSGDVLLDSLLRSHPDANKSMILTAAGSNGGASHVDNYLVYLISLGIQRRVAAAYRFGLFGLCFCTDRAVPRTWTCSRRPTVLQQSQPLSSKPLTEGSPITDPYHDCLDMSPANINDIVGSTGRGTSPSAGCHTPLGPAAGLNLKTYATGRICPAPSRAMLSVCYE